MGRLGLYRLLVSEDFRPRRCCYISTRLCGYIFQWRRSTLGTLCIYRSTW